MGWRDIQLTEAQALAELRRSRNVTADPTAIDLYQFGGPRGLTSTCRTDRSFGSMR